MKIKNTNITFVFRHKWDRKDKLDFGLMFRDYKLGVWFRKDKIVGCKNFNKPNEWHKNLVNHYMIGIDLIVCKMWLEFNRGGKTF